MTDEVNITDLDDDLLVVATSEDARDRDTARAEKVELVEAMEEVGAKLVIVEGVPRLFGYDNPKTKRSLEPMPFNDINLAHIIDCLGDDFPEQTTTAIKWELKFLFRDMPESVLKIEKCVFNPQDDNRFSHVAASDGKPTVHYNSFNREHRPITNTIVELSENDKLVGNVLYKGIESSVETITHHSKIADANHEELYSQILSTMAGFVQPRHKRLRYAPVILGKQGSGKSILANLVANAGGYVEYMSIDKLTGNFGARWNTATTVVVDEAAIKNEAQSNMLKNFLTATSIDLEEKYKGVISADIHMNFIFTTNRITDFKTYETENRRYFILTADGALDSDRANPNDKHDCITPRIKVTAKEYQALLAIGENDFIGTYDKSKANKMFEPTAASNEVSRDGMHTIVLSQLGEISTKPKAYMGAFIVMAKKLAEHYKPELKLEQLANRQDTAGQFALSANVPNQLKVSAEHGIIAGYLEDFSNPLVDRDESIVNEAYLNLNKAFERSGIHKIPNDVIDYFSSKFVWSGEKYSIVPNDSEHLLIKLDSGKQHTQAGIDMELAAKTKHNEMNNRVALDEQVRRKVALQEIADAEDVDRDRVVGEFLELFPDGFGIIPVIEFAKTSKFSMSKVKSLIPTTPALKFKLKSKSYIFDINEK